jgi:cell division transport system permease protein
VVLSVFLVLFLLGILGLFVLNSKKLSDDFKEQIVMTVFFKNEANDSAINLFKKELGTLKFVKSADYLTKDAAAKQHTDIIGEDFLTFLGENPLQNSFDVHLKAEYIDSKNISLIENKFRTNTMVSDIVYDKQLVNLVNDNIKKVSLWILIISAVLAVIAVLLINSSMRLSIYSHRFIIKTMQMVGATKSFIRKPFIWRSVKLGLLGAFFAVLGLLGVLIYLNNNFPNLGVTDDKVMIGLVFLAVMAVGGISTYFATQKFLNLRTDDLY